MSGSCVDENALLMSDENGQTDRKATVTQITTRYIYIYAFSRCLQCMQIILFFQYVCSLGIEPTTFALLKQCSTTEPREHSLQPRYAESHLWTHNTSNPEADELQKQKTTPVPLLSAKNRKQRIQFTQNHQNWTIEEWKNVAWSDESRFLLQQSDVGFELA